MDARSKGYRNVEMLRTAFWTIGKWFTLLMIILVVWAGLYLGAHSEYGFPGHEYATFSNAQIRQINRILTTDNIAANAAQVQPTRVNTTLIDSTNSITPANEINSLNTTIGCDLDCRISKVLVYVNSEFDNKVDPQQLQEISGYISTFGPQEVGVFLADHKLKIRSYFWLTGPMIYAELVSWVIAGVLCSLLFSAGNVLRRANKKVFDNRDVLYQIAKVFYAPFIAMILLLTYNFFRNNTSLSANLGQGVIIFAFISGFFSGRIMNFLDKLKQLILPDSERNPAEMEMAGYVLANTVASVPTAVTPMPTPAAPVIVEHDIEEEEIDNTEAYKPTSNGSTINDVIVKKQDNDLIDAQIEVKLDTTGLFDDEKARLTRQGFTKAIVTLHNVNGKDIIPAKRAGENSTLFIATDVKPGIYIARATLSQRLADDQIINLFGERTSYITVDKPGLELYIRKYELVD